MGRVSQFKVRVSRQQLVVSRGHRSMIISTSRSHYLATTSVDIAYKVALKMDVSVK
jgi:hypothetical protein